MTEMEHQLEDGSPARDKHPRDRVRRWSEAALVLLWLAVVALAMWRMEGRGEDDAFITYRYADNLARGRGLVFNPGERVFGTTAPGLALVLGAGRWATGVPVHWLGSAATGFALLVIAGTTLVVCRRAGHAAAGAIGGTLVVASAWAWVCQGFEGPVALAVLLLAAGLAERHPALGGMVAGLAIWLRPDAALGGALLGVILWHHGRRPPWRFALGGAAAVVSGVAAAWAWFGRVLPETWAAKHAHAVGLDRVSVEPADFWLEVVPMARRSLGAPWWLLALLGAVGLIVTLRRAGRGGRLLAGQAVALLVAYPFLGVRAAPWYPLPVVLTLVALAPLGAFALAEVAVRWLPTRSTSRRWAVAGVAGFLLASPLAAAGQRVGVAWQVLASRPHFEGYRKAAHWIAADAEPTDAIATVEIGILAYYSDLAVEDLMGLVTPRSIPFVAAGDLGGALLAKPTRYVVERPGTDGYTGQFSSAKWFRKRWKRAALLDAESGAWTRIWRQRPNATMPPARAPIDTREDVP